MITPSLRLLSSKIMSTVFTVEIDKSLSTDTTLSIQLCTGAILDLPLAVVLGTTPSVTIEESGKLRTYVRIELDTSTAEGRALCVLGRELESAQLHANQAMEAAGSQNFIIHGQCSETINYSNIAFTSDIIRYTVGGVSPDIRLSNHFQLNSRTIQVVHAYGTGGQCQSSSGTYSGKINIFYDSTP
jgi:hypothetical protein